MLHVRECKTADEVRELARAVVAKRENLTKIAPPTIENPAPPIAPRIGEVQRAVANVFNLSVQEMLTHNRAPRLSVPRMAAMAIASHLCDRSTIIIGRQFDGRDHTTVVNACRKFSKMIGCLSALLPDTTNLEAWAQMAFDYIKANPPKSYVNERRTHCYRGHPLSGNNIVIQRGGRRRCLACQAKLRERGGKKK